MSENANNIVWLEARDAMRAFGFKNFGSLYHTLEKGEVQRKANNNPKHPSSKFLYSVPRHLWESVNPTIPMREAPTACDAGASQFLSEEQIEKIAKSFATSMEFVISDELRKAMQKIVPVVNELEPEASKRDIDQVIEERAGAMARRIGFRTLADAVEYLQTVTASKGDGRIVMITASAFERRISRFNEENHASITEQDVVKDLRLYLAICDHKAAGQRKISARGSVRSILRELIAHVEKESNPAE